MKKHLLTFAMTLLPAISSFGNEEPNDSPVSFQQSQGEPIEFVPFKLEDFCRYYFNGVCDSYYTDRGQKFEKTEVFDGTIGEYLDYLNTMEQLYNASGSTLRPESDSPEDEINRPMELPTDVEELQSQLLTLLNMNTEEVIANVLGLDPNAECPSLGMPGRDIEDPGFQFPRFSVPGINDMPLDEIIARFNEYQNILCPLGMSLFEKLDPDQRLSPEQLINKLMALRDEILEKLGLSEYASSFSMESLQQIQAGIDIAQDILDLIQAKEFPSPEQLFELRDKLNNVLPEDWQIPDVPNIPSPTPPVRRDLEVKKRKDWSGFNYGERDRFATYANAYLELRGSEEEQQGTAFGAAGIYILNREINAIGGYATGFAGPSKISLDMELKAFGQEIFDPIHLSESVKIIKEDYDSFNWEFDKSYDQTFMAGPIPVTVSLGARIDIGLGYEYGIYTTKLMGKLVPFAEAEGYASGEAGIPKVLSVGAQAAITVIDAKIPLAGYAAVNFDEVGYPFIKLGIDSKLEYEALKGRAFAFANYVVPRWGLPPWKKKRAEFEIFSWRGINGELAIMNWGLELGRNGTKLTGELLDQTDRQEAQLLQDIIELEERKRALNNYQVDVQQKVQAIFEGVSTDLVSDANQEIYKFDGYLEESLNVSNSKINTYDDRLNKFFIDRSATL